MVKIGKTLLNVRALQYRHYRKEEKMSLNSHVVLNSCVIWTFTFIWWMVFC